jgi:hypothetical protein
MERSGQMVVTPMRDGERTWTTTHAPNGNSEANLVMKTNGWSRVIACAMCLLSASCFLLDFSSSVDGRVFQPSGLGSVRHKEILNVSY